MSFQFIYFIHRLSFSLLPTFIPSLLCHFYSAISSFLTFYLSFFLSFFLEIIFLLYSRIILNPHIIPVITETGIDDVIASNHLFICIEQSIIVLVLSPHRLLAVLHLTAQHSTAQNNTEQSTSRPY